MSTARIFLFLTFSCLLLQSPLAQATSSNAQLVSTGVFRGGRPTGTAELKTLKEELNIRTIINLQGQVFDLIPGESEQGIAEARENAKALGLNFYHFPIPVIVSLDKEDKANIVKAVKLMNDQELHSVYVHCNVGVDRTGIVVAAYRVLAENCSASLANEEMQNKGEFWTPLFNASQVSFLEELETHRESYLSSSKKCPLREMPSFP